MWVVIHILVLGQRVPPLPLAKPPARRLIFSFASRRTSVVQVDILTPVATASWSYSTRRSCTQSANDAVSIN
jgi:hypothetical protein